MSAHAHHEQIHDLHRDSSKHRSFAVHVFVVLTKKLLEVISVLSESLRFIFAGITAVLLFAVGFLGEIEEVRDFMELIIKPVLLFLFGLYATLLPWYLIAPLFFLPGKYKAAVVPILILASVLSFFIVFMI